LCCSSPRSHRALIAIQPLFVSPSWWHLAGDVLRDLARRHWRRQAKGPRERLAAPGSFQACQARVQICTPARLPRGDVRNNLVSCRHQADQVMLSRALPAPNAGPDRRSTCAVQLTGPLPERYLARHPSLARPLAQLPWRQRQRFPSQAHSPRQAQFPAHRLPWRRRNAVPPRRATQ
jgi:hypothetical protein